jgi:sugar phosphate isomerase/epimerase
MRPAPPSGCYNGAMERDKLSPGSPLLGALIYADAALELIPRLLDRGFESFQIAFWGDTGGCDLPALADKLAAALEGSGARASSLGVYGNTLDPEGGTLPSLVALIDAAPRFGVPLVSCFAGRLPGHSVPDSIPRWKEVFTPLSEKAEAKGLRICLENCRLGDTWKAGKWNIAINPDAWELLFSALPGAPIGLEWEPSHQILAFADPLAQLEAWAPRVLHVHGKDATLDRRALALRGAYGSTKTGREALPGSGDTDWCALIATLLRAKYSGSIDVEPPCEDGKREAAFESYEKAFSALSSARRAAECVATRMQPEE